MGKGLLTLQPYYSDKFLLNKVAISGIVTLLHGCLDLQNLILGKHHLLLNYLGLAMYPRMCFTVLIFTYMISLQMIYRIYQCQYELDRQLMQWDRLVNLRESLDFRLILVL